MSDEQASPLALQMAVRIERLDPPHVDDIVAGAARAVIELLDDERSRPGGPWHAEVAAWNGARIRKLLRRARGAAWDRAQRVPGVTIEHGTAQIRAFVPGPMHRVPAEVAKLQIQAHPLDESTLNRSLPRVSSERNRLVVAVNPTVPMTWGKRAVQCAHAGQRLWERSGASRQHAWRDAGSVILSVHPDRTRWAELLDLDATLVHDGGFTEVPAGTLTALGLWW